MARNLTVRNTLIFILVLLLAAGCLSGCSIFRRKTDPDQTASPSYSPAPTKEPVSGGTMRLPMPVNAPFEDPFDVSTEEMLNLFSLMYDKLLTLNAQGEIEPCLCESWTSEGEGAWILRLREGVKWHNGSAFDADDVVYTYESLKEMEASYYKPCLDRIEELEKLDDYTVRVRFNVTGIAALYSLLFPVKCESKHVGTGPYRLYRVDDDAIVLTANADWWDRPPYIEFIKFVERDSTSTALASFEAGQLNMIPTDILTAGKYAELGVTNVIDVMTQDMEALLFNHRDSVFSHRELRLAVAHAVNRSRIITNVYMNRARVADSPIPPDNWLNSTRSGTLGYDPERALELIEQAGFTVLSHEEADLRYSRTGESLVIKLLTSATTENTVRSDAAQLIKAELEELGFSVEIVTKKHTLGAGESDFVKALKAGDWDMALVGFNLALGCDLTSYVCQDGANNFGHIDDDELEALALSLLSADSEETLRERAYEFQNYFAENVPFMTLYFRLNSLIVSAKIAGIVSAREPMIFEEVKNWHFSQY
ncbi:MAG: hypothetical protein K6F68_01605 [Clostridiales bacterium]|nr:hypothetical protein [Clostridiales bacterium]